MELKINEELKSLLPQLTTEEFKTLEENIMVDGCREPLVIWGNTIVDGHNRYEICTKHNILFDIYELECDNFDNVKIWMIDNAKGRRNLTDGWKFELAQARKQILIKQGREKISQVQTSRHAGVSLSTIDKDTHNTRNEIAQELGWSTGKVAMADKVWGSDKADIKEKVKAGDISISQAYKEVKRDEMFDGRKANKEFKVATMPQGTYRVIYADPPWQYNDKCSEGAIQSGGADTHYPTMSIKELCEMQLPNIADDAVLFLWTTSPLLEDTFKVINAWGFKYKASFVWDKVKHNMGHYNSVRHEFLLIATKGSCTPDNLKLFDSVQSIEKTKKHSEKPEAFREIIDTLYPKGFRIELFARSIVNGWEGFGNEL